MKHRIDETSICAECHLRASALPSWVSMNDVLLLTDMGVICRGTDSPLLPPLPRMNGTVVGALEHDMQMYAVMHKVSGRGPGLPTMISPECVVGAVRRIGRWGIGEDLPIFCCRNWPAARALELAYA